MAKPKQRLWHGEAEAMQTRAEVFHANLTDDLADFTPRFPFITAAYLTSFQTDITTAKTFPLDGVVISNLKVLTADVEASVDEGYDALQTIGTYAGLAYKNDQARREVFGQSAWQKAKSDQEKMVNALEHAHRFANEDPYKTALMNKGLTQVAIDHLQAVADDINTKNGLQEAAKSKRPVTTQDRLDVNNIVYERMQEINLCAQEVYRDNYAKLQQYRLSAESSETPTRLIVHTTFNGQPLADCTVIPQNFDLAEQTTDAEGNARFESINLPEAVDFKVVHPVHGQKDFENQPIIEGEENLIEVGYP
jgi:hypothetical protein